MSHAQAEPPRPLLGAREVRRLLAAHELRPRKSLGQSFVADPNVVRRIVRDAGVGAGDVVCEIGAGLGSLTLALREAGARVVAVEVDPALAAACGEVVGGDPDVRLVVADALRADLRGEVAEAQAAWGMPDAPVAVVANLPYRIATPLLMRLLVEGPGQRLLLMVQREVGERWTAAVGDPGYAAVSVKIAALAEARLVARVPRTVFVPVPNVDSVTVALHRRPWQLVCDRARLFALIESGFSRRRKQLRNALASGGWAPEPVEAALTRAGLSPTARAEELDVDAWDRLGAVLLDLEGQG